MGRPQCEGTLFFGGGDDVTVSPSSLLGLSCLVGLWSCALAVFMAWSRGWRCWVPTGPALAKAMPRGIRLCLLALRALGLHWLGLSPGGEYLAYSALGVCMDPSVVVMVFVVWLM